MVTTAPASIGSPLHSTAAVQRRAEEIERVLAMRRREAEASLAREHEASAMVEQIQEARKEVEASLAKLQQAATTLKNLTRRNLDETSASYQLYANAHLRVTGALANGMRRTAQMDRVLNQAAAEQEAARRREEENKERLANREHTRHVNKLTLPATDEDALAEIYGEVLDA